MPVKRSVEPAAPQETLFPREKERAVLAGDDSTLDRVRQALRDALRPPHGVFRHRWSAARMPNGREGHDANQVFPLVCAWVLTDPPVARDILMGAFSLQQADDRLPRMIDAGGRALSTAAAWPLLARAALRLWEAEPDPAVLRLMLPKLERHLSWARSYYDPEPGAAPAWHGPDEAFLGSGWEEGTATVDVSALLLSEIDAFLLLASMLGSETPRLMAIQDWRHDLSDRMETLFFDATTGLYSDRRAGGEWSDRRTLSSFLPLIGSGLPPDRRETMLKALVAEDSVLIESGVALWERRPRDDRDPPCPALQQAVLLDGLDAATDGAPFARLADVLKRNLYPRLAAGRIHDDRAAARTEGSGDEPAMEAALALRLWMGRIADGGAGASRVRPWVRWLGRHPGAAVAAVAALILAALVAALIVSSTRPNQPSPSLETLGNLGRSHYEAGRYDEAAGLLGQVARRNQQSPPAVHLLFGNALFKKGEYLRAEEAYRHAAKAPDHVATYAQFNLAQTLYRQGRAAEAIQAMETFLLVYGKDYPEHVPQAQLAIDLMRANPDGGAALVEDEASSASRLKP